MNDTPSRLILGPFNRVEGDLEVTLDVEDGIVAAARVTAPMYRGFEKILTGRPPEDALTVAPRICGICSVSQSAAAARALAQAAGSAMPDNGRLTADLLLACENAADHLTHFVLFFMPDFAKPDYAQRPWHAAALRRFAAMTGDAQAELLPARSRFLHIMGLLAGKWPHSLAIQPGGSTKGVDSGERIRLLGILSEFRRVLERVVFAAPLEQMAEIADQAGLDAWADQAPGDHGDFRLFLHISRDLKLHESGRGPGRFMSYGGFGLWRSGWYGDGSFEPLAPEACTEDLTSSWMSGPNQPDLDKPDAYSWCKSPRYAGSTVEVGALARHTVDGNSLAVDLVRKHGGTVHDRVVMRMIELARLIPAMESWARAVRPGEAFCVESPLPLLGAGLGLTEAARGSLSHQIALDGGIIRDYRIIAPTTWNFSPRDHLGNPGPLESALQGVAVPPGQRNPIAVQHIVRSFDPCMACTVH